MNASLRFAEQNDGISCRFIDALLPRGGHVVVLVEAYFDESIGYATKHEAEGYEHRVNILCLAGYLIESEAAKRLCADWQAVLNWKVLPYFHMVDCAHGNGAFAKVSKPDRIQIVARMMAAIKRHTIKGFAVTVNIDQYNIFMPRRERLAGTPYSFCAHGILGAVRDWADRVKYTGDIAYFYEAGHASQPEADKVMRDMFALPEMKDFDKSYIGHAFMDKKKALPLQAADLLAWQFYTDVRRQIEGRPHRRKDFASLLQHPHQMTWVTPKMMTEIAKSWGYDTSKAEELLTLNFGPDYLSKGEYERPDFSSYWKQQP